MTVTDTPSTEKADMVEATPGHAPVAGPPSSKKSPPLSQLSDPVKKGGDGNGDQQALECKVDRPQPPAEAYSVFSKRKKTIIVAVVAFAGVFSPITANIYFPAIQPIASAFHTTTEKINLSITVYMIFQGVSPCFWGVLTDSFGRRPIYLLTLLVYEGANIGLALSNSYGLVMFFRCLQATGSASVIAIGAGTIGDISPPAERAGYMALFNLGPLAGPSIGPVLGGLLTKGFGWRSIFWFLLIAGGVAVVTLALFLPETLRHIVGNGSLPPPAGVFGHALIEYLTPSGRRRLEEGRERADEVKRVLTRESQARAQPQKQAGAENAGVGAPSPASKEGQDVEKMPQSPSEKAQLSGQIGQQAQAQPESSAAPIVPDKVIQEVVERRLARQKQNKWKQLNPLQPLIFLLEPDIAVTLGFNALMYAVYYCATATFSTLLARVYGLSEIIIGVCFLPGGIGCLLGTLFTGRLLNKEYQVIARKHLARKQANLEVAFASTDRNEKEKEQRHSKADAANDLSDFPIERARLGSLWLYVILNVGSLVGFGWSLQAKANLAVPLVMQFLIGYCMSASMATFSTLIVDLYPGYGASITAANNLLRCCTGAVAVSVIDYILNALNPGWTFVLLAGLILVTYPAIVVEMAKGPTWRARRAERVKRQKEKENEKENEDERKRRWSRRSWIPFAHSWM